VAALTGEAGILCARDAFPVTPNDGADLSVAARGLLIAVGGTLKVTLPSGATCATTVPAGFFPVNCVRVWSTGTAATGITAIV
jgi:hypothetical protein